MIQIVNDDMPFLVDSTTMEINRQGLTLHLIVHPIYAVERDAQGKLQVDRGRAPQYPQAPRESWMHMEIDRLVDAEQRDALGAGIERVLADVRAAVRTGSRCWRGCTKRSPNWSSRPATCRKATVEESRAFLQWLAEDHITLLGYRQHDLVQEKGEPALRLVPGSGLGLLRETAQEQLSASFAALPRAGAGAGRVRRCRCWWSPSPTPAPPCTARVTPTTSASSATTTAAR